MGNREIKFRAWDKTDEQMDYFDFETFCHNIMWCHGYSTLKAIHNMQGKHKDQRLFLMQYAGLKDKNGKDAYEKDVIKSTNGMIGHIEYSEVHAAFIVHTYNDDPAGEWLHNYEFEIIGNIYQNLELIKQ